MCVLSTERSVPLARWGESKHFLLISHLLHDEILEGSKAEPARPQHKIFALCSLQYLLVLEVTENWLSLFLGL